MATKKIDLRVIFNPLDKCHPVGPRDQSSSIIFFFRRRFFLGPYGIAIVENLVVAWKGSSPSGKSMSPSTTLFLPTDPMTFT